MTDKQRKFFYFPAWHEAVAANQWHMEKKRLVTPAARFTDESKQVIQLAHERALQESRGPVVDDLRHACHLLALGTEKSSSDLTNKEVDGVVALFRVLKDPEDLDARLAWEGFLEGRKTGIYPGDEKRVEWFITKTAPDAYVRAIAADEFGTRQWENLSLAQKRKLAMTLANRKTSREGTKETKETAMHPSQPSSLRGTNPF